MTLHQADFTFNEPGVGGIELDLDPKLTEDQKKDAAIEEIEFAYPTYSDVEVTKIVEIK